MKNEIIISTKIVANKPKPSKAQIVEALVETARANHEENYRQNEIRRNALEDQAIKKAKELFKKKKIEEFSFETSHEYSCHQCVNVSISIDGSEVASLLEKRKDIKLMRFDRDKTKKQIVEAMKEKNPLLEGGHQKELNNLLDSIMGRQQAIEV